MEVRCTTCGAAMDVPYYRIGLSITCSKCGEVTVPRIPLGTTYPNTGYQITYSDFIQLLTYPAYRAGIVPLIEEWFDCQVLESDDDPLLRTRAGQALPCAEVHEQIQTDPQKQFTLYQRAMSLWK
jgi:hypothetical protein